VPAFVCERSDETTGPPLDAFHSTENKKRAVRLRLFLSARTKGSRFARAPVMALAKYKLVRVWCVRGWRVRWVRQGAHDRPVDRRVYFFFSGAGAPASLLRSACASRAWRHARAMRRHGHSICPRPRVGA